MADTDTDPSEPAPPAGTQPDPDLATPPTLANSDVTTELHTASRPAAAPPPPPAADPEPDESEQGDDDDEPEAPLPPTYCKDCEGRGKVAGARCATCKGSGLRPIGRRQ